MKTVVPAARNSTPQPTHTAKWWRPAAAASGRTAVGNRHRHLYTLVALLWQCKEASALWSS